MCGLRLASLIRNALLALLLAGAPAVAAGDPEAKVREIERLAITAPVAESNARITALAQDMGALTPGQRQRVEYVRLRNLAIVGDQASALTGLQALLQQQLPTPLRVRIYATATAIAANIGQWKLAYQWLNDSLPYLPTAGDDAPRMLITASYLNGLVGEDALSREFATKALHLAEQGRDALSLCRAVAGMAQIEEHAQDYAAAGRWRMRQIEECGLAGAGDNLFVGGAEAGMGKVEMERGNPSAALGWYRSALARFQRAGYEPGIKDAGIGLASSLIALGEDLDQARTLLQNSAVYFREQQASLAVEEAERQLAALAEREGDASLALVHYKNAMAAAAEIQKTAQDRLIAYQQVQFSTRLKQQQIDLLQAQQAIAQLQITAGKRRQWLLAAGVAMLLLSVGLLVVLLRRSARDRQRYRWQSEHDGLTRLLSQKQIRKLGQAAWEQARRQGRPFSAVVLDIDHFKQVNDHYGHAAGDEALRKLGGWIEQAVGSDNLAGRSGGDEFTLLIAGDADRAEAVVREIRDAIEPIAVFDDRIAISISAGICADSAEFDSPGALVHAADGALRRAKREGRNRVVLAGADARAAPDAGGAAVEPHADRLVVVGCGIQLGRHMSPRCESEIRLADVVMCLVDPFALAMIRELRPDAVNLGEHYADGKDRRESYREIDAAIMAQVRAGKRVCAVFYGHPGVFADVPHRVVQRARAEGFSARMEPGISTEACLYADLGIDPGRHGVQSLEATQFLLQDRVLDPAGLVLLWQVALAGDLTCTRRQADRAQLQRLVDKLRRWYPADHEVILYEAARLSIETPRIDRLRLQDLPEAQYQEFTTLVIPPLATVREPADRLAVAPLADANPAAG